MTLAYGMIRVSTDDQAKHGQSLDVQRAAIERYAAEHNLELVCIERDDGISGTVAPSERPGLARVLKLAKRGTAIIVCDLTRLSRSVSDMDALLARFARTKVQLHSIADGGLLRGDADSLFMSGMKALLGAHEARRVGERVARVLRDMRGRGLWVGGRIPYGTRTEAVDGEVSKRGNARLAIVADGDSPETHMVARARELRAAGLSLRAISASLAEAGMVARCGKALAPQVVARMVA